MLVIGSRTRNQPPPPFVVFEALTQPHRDPHRPWLILLGDEHEPTIIDVVRPERVVWGSIWTRHPDAVIEFDLSSAHGGSTDLRWTLYVRPPAPRRRRSVICSSG